MTRISQFCLRTLGVAALLTAISPAFAADQALIDAAKKEALRVF